MSLKKLTLEKITQGFSKTIDQLTAIVDQNTDKAGELRDTITKFEGEISVLDTETSKAAALKRNLQQLLGEEQ